MRGLVKAGVLLAPALASAVALPEEDTIPSAFITLHLPRSEEKTTTPTRDVVFRFDIHESTDACGSGNVTIDGHALPDGGSGSLTVQEDRVIDATWNLTCVTWNGVPQEQLLSLNVDSVDGNAVEDVGFTVRFQQIAPVWISDVEGAVSMTRVHSISQPKPDCNDGNELDVDAELAELDYLRWQVHELHQKIFEKERRLFEAFGPPAHDGPHHGRPHHGRPHHGPPPMIEDCDSLRCVMKAVFHKMKVAAWPFAGDFGPGPHGPPPPGPWGRHHDHPHGPPPPFEHENPFPFGHHGNHTNNGTHPRRPHFGHPPPFCKCPPSSPHDDPHGPPPPHGHHDGPQDGPHDGAHGGPHDGPHHGPHSHHEGPPHGSHDGFPHRPPPHGMEHGSPFPPPPGPPSHEPHGFGSEHHRGSGPEGHKMKPEGMNEPGRPEPEEMGHKDFDMGRPEVPEAELRRDFDHPGHGGHHGRPHNFEGEHHDGPHHGAPHDGPPPHMHDGPEGHPPPPPFDHDGPPPPPPPPFDFDGPDHGPDHMPPPPPPPPGSHRHHRGPPGLLFIHIASVAASVVLLGIFVRVLHQRYVRRSPAFTHRRRRSYSNAPWFKKLFYGPHYQDIAEEEKEAMLRDCDSDCSSVSGGDDDVITRDTSTFRTAADVVGEMVAVEEGRMMAAGPRSREGSHGSMTMPPQQLQQQQQQQQMFAPIMPQSMPMPMPMAMPMPIQMTTVPMPISAEAAAMFPDLHHDDMVEELPAYQEADRSDDDDASELASSLMADGYRPGCSGSYTPSESGSQGASDILGDTKN